MKLKRQHISTVGHVNSFYTLQTCGCFMAAVLWVSGTAWRIESHKWYRRTETMSSSPCSCCTFYFFSKIGYQRSSVSSQSCEWLRNAGQRQMSDRRRFVVLLSAGRCQLFLDCDWMFICRNTKRSIVSKFHQYSGRCYHTEEITSFLLLDLVVYLKTEDFKRLGH